MKTFFLAAPHDFLYTYNKSHPHQPVFFGRKFLHFALKEKSHKRMSLGRQAYELVFKRSSTTVVAIVAAAFVFERIYSPATNWVFTSRNAGVSEREGERRR